MIFAPGATILVDTGPLVALRNRRDQHHVRVSELAPELPPVLYTTWPVLTETAFLMRQHPGQFGLVLDALNDGSLRLIEIGRADVRHMSRLMTKYQDQGFSLADVSLMHVAVRDKCQGIFTIDERDFSTWKYGQNVEIELVV